MPYTVKIEGVEELAEIMAKLGDDANYVASMSLYEGARELADAIKQEANAIKTAPFKYAKPGEKRLPSPEEKQILLENGAMGIAKFDKNGNEVNTSVGYNASGYADVSWNHMSSAGRTNYKSFKIKGHESNSTSFLRALGYSTKGMQDQKPVGVIANAINSGTSFMQKQPFIRQGANKGKKKASQAILSAASKWFDRLFNQYIGGKSA